MDGMNWQELYRREVDIDVTQPVRLKVSVYGDRISVGLNGQKDLLPRFTCQPVQGCRWMRPLAICQYTNQANSESV